MKKILDRKAAFVKKAANKLKKPFRYKKKKIVIPAIEKYKTVDRLYRPRTHVKRCDSKLFKLRERASEISHNIGTQDQGPRRWCMHTHCSLYCATYVIINHVF